MPIINDQKLKAYFLGTLAAEETARLEEECANDAKLTEQANIVESELADDFLRGNLTAPECRSFEENYLITEARREKLQFAQNLWKVTNENQTADLPAPSSIWQTLFGNPRRLAFGGLLAVLLCGGFILVWLNFNKTAKIAKQENVNQSPAPNTVNQTNEKNSNAANENLNFNANSNLQKNGGNKNIAPKSPAAPETKTTPTPKPIEPPAPTLATFALLPGTLRSEGEQFIKIAPKTDKINLRLTLPKDAAKYESYRAVLQTADGEIVFTAPNLKATSFTMPAAKLENRTYILFLEGQTTKNQPAESITEYTFRVKRQ